jgi:hypothetical protein
LKTQLAIGVSLGTHYGTLGALLGILQNRAHSHTPRLIFREIFYNLLRKKYILFRLGIQTKYNFGIGGAEIIKREIFVFFTSVGIDLLVSET